MNVPKSPVSTNLGTCHWMDMAEMIGWLAGFLSGAQTQSRNDVWDGGVVNGPRLSHASKMAYRKLAFMEVRRRNHTHKMALGLVVCFPGMMACLLPVAGSVSGGKPECRRVDITLDLELAGDETNLRRGSEPQAGKEKARSRT